MAPYDTPDQNGSDFVPRKRDRSGSNENFNLPPLPCLEENRDLQNLENPDFRLDNYKSNEQQTNSSNKMIPEEEDDEASLLAQKSIK